MKKINEQFEVIKMKENEYCVFDRHNVKAYSVTREREMGYLGYKYPVELKSMIHLVINKIESEDY